MLPLNQEVQARHLTGTYSRELCRKFSAISRHQNKTNETSRFPSSLRKNSIEDPNRVIKEDYQELISRSTYTVWSLDYNVILKNKKSNGRP